LIALNFAAAAAAAAASWLLYRRVFGWQPAFATILTCLWLLSFVVVKHFAMPVTEIVFTAIVFISLAAMDQALRSRSVRLCALMMSVAALSCALSISVRTAGIALLPSLFAGAILIARRWWRGEEGWTMKRAAAVILPVLAVASGLSLRTLQSQTLTTYTRHAEQGGFVSSSVIGRLSYRMQEAGELFLNGTSGKLPQWVPFQLLGLPLFIIVAAALYSRRRRAHIVDLFFLTYMAMIFAWPFFDSRFWVPVVPVLAAYMAVFFRQALPRRAAMVAGPAYASLFALGGCIAIGYSLWLTFSAERFPERYGRGSMRAEYCSIYPCASVETLRPPDPDFVEVLRRYR
jgi:hypothetical protein